MVELQSCHSLVNAAALCAIEQEVKGESTVIIAIAEISAELQREREKNAELLERISILEAQIQRRDEESSVPNAQCSCITATERSLKKFKRQKIKAYQSGFEEKVGVNGVLTSHIKLDTRTNPPKESNMEDRLVNWMSMDESQFSHVDKLKNDDLAAADCDDTEDSDEEEDCEEVDIQIDHKNEATRVDADQMYVHEQNSIDEGAEIAPLGNFFGVKNATGFQCVTINQEAKGGKKSYCISYDTELKRDIQKQHKKETDENSEDHKTSAAVSKEGCQTGPGNTSSSIRKPQKVAFCPKEVRRILECEGLQVKNAQSHTIRKIIVFASLGTRHGCDDMYELDFNHFNIFRKGEPYMSAKDPGEHVLYENPGIRRKMFFPNRKNPTLCPVQIIEEEKAMRPSDPSCPSCLFLCIKYGGRTRNLPQNEYVRQRMGRNKLKSFGPLMCRMAMLVHIRSGSFFFKALGITLLFMAGFPDDLVQRETKYRNLDLLQKYYRTDEDAEGDQIFVLQPMTCDNQASPGSVKSISTKSKGKKQANSTSKPNNLPIPSVHQSAPATQFGLMGYSSIQTRAVAPFQSTQPQTPQDILQVPNQAINNHNTNPILYHMYPPLPFMPMMHWSPPNAYGCQAFPSTANYYSIPAHPYYTHPSYTMAQRNSKNDAVLEEADSDSDSGSSSSHPKEAANNALAAALI